MSTSAFSRAEALRVGWNTMKQHLRLLIPLVLITWFVSLLQRAIAQPEAGRSHLLGWLLALGLEVVHLAIGLGWIRIALRLNDGAPASLGDLMAALPRFFDYLLASVLYGLIVLAGLVLFIVPGIVWAIRYGFYGFLIVDRELDPLTALKQSAAMTSHVKGQLFLFGLLCLGVNLLGALAFGIGLLATLPTTAVAMAHVYRGLLPRLAGVPARPPQAPQPITPA